MKDVSWVTHVERERERDKTYHINSNPSFECHHLVEGEPQQIVYNLLESLRACNAMGWWRYLYEVVWLWYFLLSSEGTDIEYCHGL